MASLDTPAPLRLRAHVPTLREILMAAQIDRAVAIAAIVSGAAVLIVAITALGVIAATAGDVVGLSVAIGASVTALAGLVAKVRSNSNGNGGTGPSGNGAAGGGKSGF